MINVLISACTHDPLTEFYQAREIPLPHLVDTTDPQDGQQLRDNKEIRREDQADMPRMGSETQAAKRQRAKRARQYVNPVGNGVPKEGEGQHPAPHCKSHAHNDKRLQKRGKPKARTDVREGGH